VRWVAVGGGAPGRPGLAMLSGPGGCAMRLAALLAVAFVAGYVVGALSPATMLARRRGVDLATAGSGNPGATNAGRVLGRRAGVVVGLLDAAKGAVPAAAFGAADYRAGLLAGLAAVIGHISSPFLRGRGGRGVATSAGAILGSHPLLLPIVLAVWIAVVAITRWVALGSILGAATLPLAAYLLRRDEPLTLIWSGILAIIVIVRHESHLRAGRRR
jgi:acyl phosphate:glycerol-3-phosphate acyltransferase